MGRTKQYVDDAARQRAWRARNGKTGTRENRKKVEGPAENSCFFLFSAVEQLNVAVLAAAAAGDPTAKACTASTAEETLLRTTEWFTARAERLRSLLG